MLRNWCHCSYKIFSLYNCIQFLAILYPESLNLMGEVGTTHNHQILFAGEFVELCKWGVLVQNTWIDTRNISQAIPAWILGMLCKIPTTSKKFRCVDDQPLGIFSYYKYWECYARFPPYRINDLKGFQHNRQCPRYDCQNILIFCSRFRHNSHLYFCYLVSYAVADTMERQHLWSKIYFFVCSDMSHYVWPDCPTFSDMIVSHCLVKYGCMDGWVSDTPSTRQSMPITSVQVFLRWPWLQHSMRLSL